jgi:hypothetical protein
MVGIQKASNVHLAFKILVVQLLIKNQLACPHLVKLKVDRMTGALLFAWSTKHL